VRRQSVAARSVYEALVAAEKEGDFAALVRCVWQLLKEHPKSIFVGPAVLDMAAARPGMPTRMEEYAAWITHMKDAGVAERSLVLVANSRAGVAEFAVDSSPLNRFWSLYFSLDPGRDAALRKALLLEIMWRFPGNRRRPRFWDYLSRNYLDEENYAEALRCLVAWRLVEESAAPTHGSRRRQARIEFCRAALLGTDERLDTLEAVAFDRDWPVPEVSVIYADLMLARGRKEALIWKAGVALSEPKPSPGARTIERYLSMIRWAETGDAKSLGALIRKGKGRRLLDWQEEKAPELLGVMADGGNEEAGKILDRRREK
jgi:hypothetical protein